MGRQSSSRLPVARPRARVAAVVAVAPLAVDPADLPRRLDADAHVLEPVERLLLRAVERDPLRHDLGERLRQPRDLPRLDVAVREDALLAAILVARAEEMEELVRDVDHGVVRAARVELGEHEPGARAAVGDRGGPTEGPAPCSPRPE